ncbi:hypothetical protein [Nisaea sediminum]|uniref:hypothetical protein n=1 Tax=Nisaea sediminum TaxID=2775867 RepID=UPI001865EA31|nr:hypothetical protein [Nisaea sediminum]
MTMDVAIGLLRYGVLVWLLAMMGVVALGMLGGRIRTAGILTDRLDGGGRAVNLHRVQMLLVFIFVLAAYAKTVAEAMGGAVPLTQMPDPPVALTELLLASQGVYLGGKVVNRL